MKIKKNDNVKILSGKDRNKTGKVLSVLPKKERILVEGLNLYKKHVRPKRQGEKGETISVPRSINVSNVMLICPACGKATRIGSVVNKGVKSRICKRCSATI